MKLPFLFLIITLNCSIATAQLQKLQFQFSQYTPTAGLASFEVNSVVQDKNGYIWIGTAAGLQRFDGIRYKTFLYDKDNPHSIPSNIIRQLMIDNENNLWVMTSEGQIGIFNTEKLLFQKINVNTSTPDYQVYALKNLYKDEFGNVFLILRGSELLVYDKATNEFSNANKFFKTNFEWKISGFAQQPGTKKYWFARQSGGFGMFNAATRKFSLPENNSENERTIDAFNTKFAYYNFFFDKSGQLWYNDWEGPSPYSACYDIKNNKPVLKKFYFNNLVKSYYELHGVFQQKNGTIWTYGSKIFARYRDHEKDFQVVTNEYKNDRSIVYEYISCLFEDRENNIWVGTTNNGLYRFNPQEEFFTNISHVNKTTGSAGTGSLLSFIQTKWGTLFAGAWGDGLYHYDKDLNPIPVNIKGIGEKSGFAAWSMYASGDSTHLWMSAQPGIYRINQDTRTSEFFNPSSLQNRTVRQLVEDKMGNLWTGMQGIGLFKWIKNQKTGKYDNEPERFAGVPATTINKVIADSRGLIWVATPKNGVFAIDPVNNTTVMNFSTKSEKEMRVDEDPFSSVLDYNDSLVIFTSVNRVYVYNRVQKKIYNVGSKELIGGFIATLEKDTKGYLWIGTTTGLYRVNIQKGVFIRFDRHDGIANDHFTLAASRLLPDGRILMGSSEQFIAFNPDKILVSTARPILTITGLEVMNKSLQADSLLQLRRTELKYNQNSVVIEFSPMVYNSAYLLRYKMEGLDEEWKPAGKDNRAVYSYLPPGKYTFRLIAFDENGNQMEAETKLMLRINRPFWKQWWFYSFEALLLIALLFWYDRERMRRKEAVQKMRNEIADNLHKEVNTSLNNINILSEMARLKADSDPQKSKEYIEQIHSKSHNMIIAVDDMLWSIDPANDNMERTVERMKEFIDALRNRYGAEIDLLVDKKVEHLELNMKLRHEAFVLFKEGIKSLVDAGTKFCQIHIGLESGKLVFTIQFDNDDCDMQQLHNLLQRRDMEKRLNSINASLKTEIHKSSSLIVLQVPVEE